MIPMTDGTDAQSVAQAFVLASASPRRRELLTALGATFRIIATDAEEREDPAPAHLNACLPSCPVPHLDHPTLRAWRKAHAVASAHPQQVILAADTIVVLNGVVLNKPLDAAHAHEMLARLAGCEHTVYTGLCLYTQGGFHAPRPQCIYTDDHAAYALELVKSMVSIAPLTSNQIAAYVATGEPLDKAGAYGIQGLGGRLVQQVVGSYTAVVGLPIATAYALLVAAGIDQLHAPEGAYYRWLELQGKAALPWPPTLP